MKISNRNLTVPSVYKTIICVIYMSLIFYAPIFACEYCNRKFSDEITNGHRRNSIVAKEMLLAMNNQLPLVASANVVMRGEEFAEKTRQDSQQIIPSVVPVAPVVLKEEFIDIIQRDERLPIPATGYVPQNTIPTVKVSIDLSEGEVYMGNGVIYNGFTTNGQIPGPTIIVNEGDIVEFSVVNKGAIPHGASIHSAYTQTSKYLGKIDPGKTATMVFKVNMPGVYLYHCAPGGHAIPMHIIFGQYGMMVVKPKKKFKLEELLNKNPDVEIYLTQHEWYANGKDAIDSKPMYVTFNGKIFRYVEEPIKAKPGDYVRIHFLNAGPNLISTFHIVGIIWDFAYWQGNPDVAFPGGQSVLAGPTDSWTIEFRMPPDEGTYTMLTHAVGSTDRGAIGLLICDKNATTPLTVLSDGPSYTEEEFKELKSKSIRTISPFEPGSLDVDKPVEYSSEIKEVTIQIIGNSYYPKRVKVSKGTTIKWINEDVFTYMEGEFSGIHNTVSIEGPEMWASPLLAHAETFSHTLNKTGEYKYMCTPHPYMKGEIIVTDIQVSQTSIAPSFNYVMIALGLILLSLLALMIIAILKIK